MQHLTLCSFTYHNDGAIKRDTRSGVAYDYSSNRAGRIGIVTVAGVAQSSQAYDAFNRLRVRTLTSATATPGTTHYVWDIFGHIVAEHVVGAEMAREYVWLGDTPLAVVDASAGASGLYYVHVDHLDRPALMTDAVRAVVWRDVRAFRSYALCARRRVAARHNGTASGASAASASRCRLSAMWRLTFGQAFATAVIVAAKTFN
ncbi:uncharacterized protein RhaS with RHS repeats [Methylopila jiangsuensis]|nr:uncharacterized protein RhaS with RHS repeats [Methylopila jiangsuensis]